MAKTTIRQSSFAAGEISPRSLGRSDLPMYGESLARCRNWLIHPQGSITRRPGLKYIGTAKTVATITETERSNPSAIDLNSVVYADELELWVAVGDDAGTDSYIIYSDDDGFSWTAATTVPADDNLYSVCWSGSLLVAVGASGTIYTSGDADTWTSQTSGTSNDLYWVISANGTFVAVGRYVIITSSDGSTWTSRDAADIYEAVVYSTDSGKLIALGEGGYKESTDSGATWSSIDAPSSFLGQGSVYHNNKFWLVGQDSERTPEQVGNAQAFGGVSDTAVAALSMTRVAWIDAGNDTLFTYEFDGTNWSQVGNGLIIPGLNTPSLSSLSSSRVALTNGATDELITYDFDGTDWSQTGNSLSISGVSNPDISALSSSRVAFIDAANDKLRTYDFDGTDWSQTGNGLPISGVGVPALAALSSSRVAFIDSVNDKLRTYDFDGTDWSQTGNGLPISGVLFPSLAALTSSRVAMVDSNNLKLRTYDFDGTDWSQTGNSLSTPGRGIQSLSALSSARIAILDDGQLELRTIRMFSGTGEGRIYEGTGDGTWTSAYSGGASTTLYDIVGSGDTMIAVGQGGNLAYSTDGGSNFSSDSIESITLRGIEVGNGYFCLVGDDDTTDAQIFTIPEDARERRLIDFAAPLGASYMMELGHRYIRFYRREDILESSPGNTVEVTTPYDGPDLADLQVAQANDVIYLAHRKYAPRKLERTGEASFSISAPDFEDGPYLPENGTVITITPSGTSGSITLTASLSLFEPTDVGRYVRIFEGTVWGYVKITAYSSATSVTGTVQGDALGGTDATERWMLGAFSDTTGYPRAVAFYQQRLIFAGTDAQPMNGWASVSGDFENFRPTQVDDTVLADDGTYFQVATRRLNTIRWLISGPVLYAGTGGGVYRIFGDNQTPGISPLTTTVELASEYNAAKVTPTLIGEIAVYAQSEGRHLRAVTPRGGSTREAPDLTLFAEHVTRSRITDMAYAAVPSSVMWARRQDGKLVGLTIHQIQENAGWHLHEIGGSLTGNDEPKVLSLAVLPTSGHDQLWVIVRRTVNGSDVDYIEAMDLPWDTDVTNKEYALTMDSAVLYDGPSTTSITGLSHLEGQSVYAYADGATQGPFTVSSGGITLTTAASVVWVGLSTDSEITTVPVRFGEYAGHLTDVYKIILDLLDTMGIQAGDDLSNLYDVALSSTPFTGDVEHPIPSNTVFRSQISLKSKPGLPASVNGITQLLEFKIP